MLFRSNFLLVSKEFSSLREMTSILREDSRLKIIHASSADRAMQDIRNSNIDVAVVSDELQDMAGLQFIAELVAENPFINCALVSSLYPDEFHEQTEGLGVFMQLPVNPDAKETKQMFKHLEKIYQLV